MSLKLTVSREAGFGIKMEGIVTSQDQEKASALYGRICLGKKKQKRKQIIKYTFEYLFIAAGPFFFFWLNPERKMPLMHTSDVVLVKMFSLFWYH